MAVYACAGCVPGVFGEAGSRYRPPAFDAAALVVADPAGAARPADAPDVLILAFSGRCDPSVCVAPDGNSDDLARDTLPALIDALADAGVNASFLSYRAHVEDHPLLGRGYRSANADVERLLADAIARRRDPTRLVLLGHSHGTQFAHLLAFEHPEVAFEASVLLDSVCLAWDADHARTLVEALAPGVGTWGPTTEDHVGCDVLDVPGVGRRDLGDVVPWNVTASLEIQSGGQVMGLVRDVTPNLRLDGSTLALDLVRFPEVHHRDIDEPGSPAFPVIVSWLTSRLRVP